ncbi:MAG: hypothetical protein E6Q89_05905 [Bacteroidia bacterium]|nr:MAG: hypothetical protein E6Q89_05905 [Bacteroidia bacterium]
MKIGAWCEADSLEILEKEVFSLKQNGMNILNFSEFSHLLRTQVLTHIPNNLAPDIIATNRVLNATDAEIAKETTLPPQAYKRLCYGVLLKKQNEKYKKRILHETEILKHIRTKETPSLLDFQDYLFSFFSQSFEQFFPKRAFNLSINQLKAHSYISAGSGHGKSELIKQLVYGVMETGNSAIILDPHGKLAREIAQWREFIKEPERLVYFDPYAFGENLEHIPILNPLAPLKNAVDRDAMVEGFIDTMKSVIDDKDAPSDRMKSILKACLYTFANYGQEVDLYDLMDFLGTGERADYWKNQARKLLTNQSLLEMVEDLDKREYTNTKTAIRDRLRVLLASDALDSCLIGTNTINLAHAMNSGKIIVFRLPSGKGEDTSKAFGRLLISSIFCSAMQRLDGKKRKDVFLFMDEGDSFMSENVIKIYKETRKYGVFITFIQQVAGYGMSSEQWRAVKTNSLLRFAGNVGGDGDGAKIVSEMLSVQKEEISGLLRGYFWVKYGIETPRKIKIGSELADGENGMSADQWTRVLEYQKSHYYQPRRVGRKTQKTVSGSREIPPDNLHQEKKIPGQKNNKNTPLDFDL